MTSEISDDAINGIKAWQQDFYRGIFNPTSGNIKQACLDINTTDELSAAERLTIYRDSILGGISSGLMGIYPVCTRLVGETFFIHMVAGYLKKYPSGSADMGDYGEFLADYLDVFLVKVDQQEDLKYLSDVARLEWLWHQAFNAVEFSIERFTPITELANITPEQQGRIIFKLQPSLGLLSSNYPIDQIWQGNQLAESQQDESDLGAITLDEEYREYAIWRSPDFSMRIERISIAGGLSFLKDVQQGQTFAEIAAKEYLSPVEVLLPHFLQSGLIVGFILSI
jgi:hypothetical protein